MNGYWVLFSVLLWIASCAASVGLVLLAIVSMPGEYFVSGGDHRTPRAGRHPFIRWSARILKNVAGGLAILVGFFLLLPGVPGQGLLTVLAGLLLIDLPGKRRWELALIRRPRVRRWVNRIRRRCGRSALRIPRTRSTATVAEEETERTRPVAVRFRNGKGEIEG